MEECRETVLQGLRLLQNLPMTEENVKKLELIKDAGAHLMGLMIDLGSTDTPACESQRYYALAKTHLENSIMWFVKGLSRSGS